MLRPGLPGSFPGCAQRCREHGVLQGCFRYRGSFQPNVLPSCAWPWGAQQEGREEDQRLINLVGESLRLLGNTFVALSDLRCNLACAPPRHLHVVRPMSHYTTPMVLQQAAIPIQVGRGSLEGRTMQGCGRNGPE